MALLNSDTKSAMFARDCRYIRLISGVLLRSISISRRYAVSARGGVAFRGGVVSAHLTYHHIRHKNRPFIDDCSRCPLNHGGIVH